MRRLILSLVLTLAVFAALPALRADENHEIIEKAMKEGMKNDESPFVKIKEGVAKDADYKAFFELMSTLEGTKAPRGGQAAYDKKVKVLITAAKAATEGERSEAKIEALKEAANCKACHKEHKPERKK